MNISEMLKVEEGFRSEPYVCSEGYPTIGIGWKIGRHNQSLNDFEVMQISEEAAQAQCKAEIHELEMNLHCVIDCWQDLNEARQAVLISMAYQMGLSGLMKFKNMLAAIETQCWNDAAHEGLDSRWATQTSERAERQMRTLLLGDWSEYE
tara:strand:- start:121 stop:570 length:450 start_codon:yes stop_codon:yes gene_type:complete